MMSEVQLRMKPGLDTEEVDRCILCEDSAAGTDGRFARLLGLVPPYAVRVCDGCGLRWLSPRPTEAGYAQLYSYENYFQGDAVPQQYADIIGERRIFFRRRIAGIGRRFPAGKSLAILDVGAATGEFLAEAAAAGHEVQGIELSAGARERARASFGISISAQKLEDTEGSEVFDVIHMNHVLEHLPDPGQALAECRRLLRPGGILLIEVPQQIDNDVERLKRRLGLLRPVFDLYSLHHTYFFRPANLAALLEKHGFVIDRLATANLDRTPFRPFRPRILLLRFYLLLADRIHRGGNIIEVFARKPE